MLILVTYDVNTETPEGKRRLRQVANKCVSYGIRVQNSVFECNIDNAQYHQMKADLVALIDKEKDSLRFYILGNSYHNKTDHVSRCGHRTFSLFRDLDARPAPAQDHAPARADRGVLLGGQDVVSNSSGHTAAHDAAIIDLVANDPVFHGQDVTGDFCQHVLFPPFRVALKAAPRLLRGSEKSSAPAFR